MCGTKSPKTKILVTGTGVYGTGTGTGTGTGVYGTGTGVYGTGTGTGTGVYGIITPSLREKVFTVRTAALISVRNPLYD